MFCVDKLDGGDIIRLGLSSFGMYKAVLLSIKQGNPQSPINPQFNEVFDSPRMNREACNLKIQEPLP